MMILPIGTSQHQCWQQSCGASPVVQWRRRLTAAELDALLTADPGSGPLASASDCTQAVHSCGAHSISVDLAAHVHEAACSAPVTNLLPGCGCAPEPIPTVTEPMDQPTVTLPTGWTIPTP